MRHLGVAAAAAVAAGPADEGCHLVALALAAQGGEGTAAAAVAAAAAEGAAAAEVADEEEAVAAAGDTAAVRGVLAEAAAAGVSGAFQPRPVRTDDKATFTWDVTWAS